jgi:hypothetical protein
MIRHGIAPLSALICDFCLLTLRLYFRLDKTDAEWFACHLSVLAKNFKGSEKKLDKLYHNVASSIHLGKIRVAKTFLTDAGESIARKTTVSSNPGPACCEVGCQPLMMPASPHAGKRKQKPFSRKDGGEAMSKKVLKMPR